MSFAADEYPLFPLPLVLFPGGTVDLRIFEPRYLAMVRDCTRANRPFGICLVIRGRLGHPASALAVGTLAHIIDFSTLPDGLLGIRCRGGQRFHVESAHARHDGLIIGRLTLWADEASEPLPPEYGLLATLVGHLQEALDPRAPQPDKADIDNASWVGFRLAETLPFTLGERQQLLELRCPLERLQRILDALPRFRSNEAQD
jgi:Lon protease-like protein